MPDLIRRPAAATARYVSEWTSVRNLARHRQSWQQLLEEAIEPNAFYSPDYLLASADEIEQADIRCVAVFDGAQADARLVGLFPLMRASLIRGALLPCWEFYCNDYICATSPLVHRDDPETICRSFLETVTVNGPSPRTLIARFLPVTRGGAAALRAALAATGCAEAPVARHDRAAVETKVDVAGYLASLSSNRRKDIRRRERRLTEQGNVTVHHFDPGTDRRAALDEFLRVEASGWKANGGTALAVRDETRRFAERAFLGANGTIDLLAVDGRAVAACASLVAQGVQYTVKTAYDEAWRASSPGQILDLHMLNHLCAGGSLVRADSCASADHKVGELWREREIIDWVVFGLDAGISQTRVNGLASTLRSVERLRTWMKGQINPA